MKCCVVLYLIVSKNALFFLIYQVIVASNLP